MSGVLRVCARVVVDHTVEHAVTSDWGPVFFHADEGHAARIRPGSSPIAPGGEGRMTLDVFSPGLARQGLRQGDAFELRDGSDRVIARAFVERASEVRLKAAPALA